MVASCLVLLKVVPGTSTAATSHVTFFVHPFILVASICLMHAMRSMKFVRPFDSASVVFKQQNKILKNLNKIIKAMFSNASINGNLPILCS